MTSYLLLLEPRYLKPNQMLMEEKITIAEQYYIMKGKVDIGFNNTINKYLAKAFKLKQRDQAIKYVVTVEEGNCVGIELNFSLKAKFYYKVSNTYCDCLSIRKTTWRRFALNRQSDIEMKRLSDRIIFKFRQKQLYDFMKDQYFPITQVKSRPQSSDNLYRKTNSDLFWKLPIQDPDLQKLVNQYVKCHQHNCKHKHEEVTLKDQVNGINKKLLRQEEIVNRIMASVEAWKDKSLMQEQELEAS